jgi:hypothetical protein
MPLEVVATCIEAQREEVDERTAGKDWIRVSSARVIPM